MKKLTNQMHISINDMRKCGGSGKVVQTDETMLNYKCKSLRGRCDTKKTDAICIFEVANSII
ncbi:hypothetical protein COBT_002719 [Conglomerata obtusa]